MVLCVAGNVEPQKVCDMAREILPSQAKPPIPRDCGEKEPRQVFARENSRTMAVSAPLLQLGIKGQPAEGGAAQLRQRLLGELACEALAGNSSPLYNRLYEKGLINSSFYLGYMDYPGCAFLVAGGETKDPEGVRDAILQEGKRIAEEGMEEAFFQRLKKAAYGAYVRGLNSFENIAVTLTEGYFHGYDPFRFPQVFDSITKEDVAAFLRRNLTAERAVLSEIVPREN